MAFISNDAAASAKKESGDGEREGEPRAETGAVRGGLIDGKEAPSPRGEARGETGAVRGELGSEWLALELLLPARARLVDVEAAAVSRWSHGHPRFGHMLCARIPASLTTFCVSSLIQAHQHASRIK